MGGGRIDAAADFRDLLRAFVDHDVRFLIVGAYALAVLGRPRATGDLDVWVEPTPANAQQRLHGAVRVRRAGTASHRERPGDPGRRVSDRLAAAADRHPHPDHRC